MIKKINLLFIFFLFYITANGQNLIYDTTIVILEKPTYFNKVLIMNEDIYICGAIAIINNINETKFMPLIIKFKKYSERKWHKEWHIIDSTNGIEDCFIFGNNIYYATDINTDSLTICGINQEGVIITKKRIKSGRVLPLPFKNQIMVVKKVNNNCLIIYYNHNFDLIDSTIIFINSQAFYVEDLYLDTDTNILIAGGPSDGSFMNLFKINLEQKTINWVKTFNSHFRIIPRKYLNYIVAAGNKIDKFEGILKITLSLIDDSTGNILNYTEFTKGNLTNWLNGFKIINDYGIIMTEINKSQDPNNTKTHLEFVSPINFNHLNEIEFSYYNYYMTTGNGFDIFVDNIIVIVGTLYNRPTVRNGFMRLYLISNLTNNDEALEDSKFLFFQNYPNPFNTSTKFKFTLPYETKVTLKVYNILGQEVATILENKELPAGNHEYEFNAAGLTTGTYFYRMFAGNFVQTKKMVLIK